MVDNLVFLLSDGYKMDLKSPIHSLRREWTGSLLIFLQHSPDILNIHGMHINSPAGYYWINMI